ncbi:MAG: hypothetical protein KC609_22160, partial [Myxococcales bacterium]|nr:hypothetical protein [Myxococcales bacterium]
KLAIGAAVSSIDPFRHELTARRANPRADFRLSAGDELGDLWRAVAATGARTVGERVDGGDPNVLELVESYGAESTWWIPFAWVGGAALIALTVVPSVGPRVGIPLVVAWLAGLITFITVRASRRNREERGYQMRVGPGGWQLSERKTGKTFASSHAGAVEFRPLHWETRGRYYHYAGPALSVKGLLRKRVTIAVMDPTQRWALDCPAANRIHYVCSKTDWPKLLTALAVNAPLGAHDPGHPS